MAYTILITGGVGYIGSHIALLCAQQGYAVVVLDKKSAVPQHNITYVQGDVGDQKILAYIFTTYRINAVIHCAALINVGDSVHQPLAYYYNNVSATLVLLDAMVQYTVPHIIFSSSCAVYGEPQWTPLTEDHPKNPLSPYGATKLMTELMLADFCKAYANFSYVALRYFNAAGAWPEYGLGELHEPETHLIPLLLRAAYGQKPCSIFGTSYATPDGTCIRDFLHVRDIAHAHVQALKYLRSGGPSDSFNIGTGTGVSVREMIATVAQVTGLPLHARELPARAGDPALLVAQAHKAHTVLEWQPHFSSIKEIVRSADMFYQQKRRDDFLEVNL